MTDTAKEMPSKRAGYCESCNSRFEKGDMFYWYDRKAYCRESCLPGGVQVDRFDPKKQEYREKAYREKQEAKPPSITKYGCATCDASTNAEEMQTFVLANGDFIRVCPKCAWLAKAQFRLKCKGLWRPTPKVDAEERQFREG